MTLYLDREIHPRVKDLQHPRLGKPRRGLQIFDTRVDFPVPVQSGGRFLYFITLDKKKITSILLFSVVNFNPSNFYL